ncbi:putative C6 transcription factor [Aspergillus novofumigatus IBT 16806]|uniref:Putative fungal-specific transcription factor n=1 Tax=Aspergillus novofumigatus (strain IBT 16806) TaxID=1392255 RepID=A0A2I1BZH2_ASPN1|nr:putative fungal-specific transcription factor [Aspergillus novofumigatus IBT 16806]PKX90754.1 putative fungal-specific transcription factor [Aspergillus novofumigatus IBT 16806]
MEVNTTVASRLVPIASAPRATSADVQNGPDTSLTTMPFNCQACVRKKVKCNRAVPTCSSCSKAKLQCVYQAPLPRKRKRSQVEDVYGRLARYERILQENNLLPTESTPTSCGNGTETSAVSTRDPTPVQPARSGTLLSADGKSRYVDNVLLLDAGEGDLCELSDSDRDDFQHDDTGADQSTPTGLLGVLAAHTVFGAILGSTQSLANQHPSYEEATKLWNTYVQNVEPLCKVLHVPTVAKMVDTVSQQPAAASKSDNCLLFAIYYFAVFSMSDADCLLEFNQTRKHLMSRYRTAVCQALVSASWLKTTALPVLQAYSLFLIAMRAQIDSHTFWILTGIAIRLAQRMGLHRDGESLGLPPFESQMRRRLFWQLLPLDGYAGQVCGTGISISPNSWDTKPPLNINDDQISPGMTQQPQEQRGASEMIFCLSRIELSNFYTRTGVKMKETGGTIQFRDAEETERLIDEVEDLIETRFLRYCDILNPLHVFTMGIVRSAANAVRLRARMPLLLKHTITDAQRRGLCTLAEKILDTNSAIYGNPSMKKFLWQMQAFFLWDALLCILLSLSEVGFYSTSELNTTWNKVAEVYANHEELVKRKRTLHVTIGRQTLKAWIANPPSNSSPEPAFITALRAQHEPKVNRQQGRVDEMGGTDKGADGVFAFNELFADIDGTGLNLNTGFALDSSDWVIWDQLCRGTSLG